jgi:hypothetical protein
MSLPVPVQEHVCVSANFDGRQPHAAGTSELMLLPYTSHLSYHLGPSVFAGLYECTEDLFNYIRSLCLLPKALQEDSGVDTNVMAHGRSSKSLRKFSLADCLGCVEDRINESKRFTHDIVAASLLGVRCLDVETGVSSGFHVVVASVPAPLPLVSGTDTFMTLGDPVVDTCLAVIVCVASGVAVMGSIDSANALAGFDDAPANRSGSSTEDTLTPLQHTEDMATRAVETTPPIRSSVPPLASQLWQAMTWRQAIMGAERQHVEQCAMADSVHARVGRSRDRSPPPKQRGGSVTWRASRARSPLPRRSSGAIALEED